MNKIGNENNVMFDIDGTLVLYGKEGPTVKLSYHGIELRELVPHTGHISFLKALKKRGFTIFVWSNNGADWAEEVVTKLNIKEYCDYAMTKPQKVIDDENVEKFIKTVYIPFEEHK